MPTVNEIEKQPPKRPVVCGFKIPKPPPEVQPIKDVVNPTCPYCQKEMNPFNYNGYYDSFSGWVCECETFSKKVKDVEEITGCYA